MANTKELVLEHTDTGCIVPTSHKLNQDGYFRKRFTMPDGESVMIMYHRYVWEQKYGKIPEGYEVDHICRNRACCNTDHLQLLTIKEHKVKTNQQRYKDRHLEAEQYWSDTGCTGTELGDVFNVTFSTGCRWIRDWKSKEGAETIPKGSTLSKEG